MGYLTRVSFISADFASCFFFFGLKQSLLDGNSTDIFFFYYLHGELMLHFTVCAATSPEIARWQPSNIFPDLFGH